MALTWQQPLPPIYNQLSDVELRIRIQAAKQRLGAQLVILGHHYQQDDVLDFADYSGDSFELSRKAASHQGAKYVIFCGVHFMAESADILTDPSVRVILPDMGAGCSMADMANLDQTLDCWAQLEEACPNQHIIPITYINSTAAIKAFVGQHGGAVCTSSNCRKVLEWALSQGTGGAEGTEGTGGIGGAGGNGDIEGIGGAAGAGGNRGAHQPVKILFFPDQHLGRNTAFEMGYPLNQMLVWDPTQPYGGHSEAQLRDARFILWKGHCSVHQLFRPEHVDQARAKYPGVTVMVHPECSWEVVQKADLSGSTAKIVKTVQAAPAGSIWSIGTEVHLVTRLAKQNPDKKIYILSDCQCLCTTMYRIDLPHLCWAIENLAEGTIVNEVKVDPETRQHATLALNRMLEISK